jgi:hypothetical protein
MDCARIDWTKVTLDTANFLLEDLVPESRLKFTLTPRGRSNTHRLLSTAQKHLSMNRFVRRGAFLIRDIMLTYGRFGMSEALFNGVSVEKVLMT